MTIVPAGAIGATGIGQLLSGALSAIQSAEQLRQFAIDHPDLVDGAQHIVLQAANTLGDTVRSISERIPRPPPGQRLRINDARYETPQGGSVRPVNATPHVVKRLRDNYDLNAGGARGGLHFTVRRTFPRRYRRRRFARRY